MGLNLKENAAKAGRKLIGRQSRIDNNITTLGKIYDYVKSYKLTNPKFNSIKGTDEYYILDEIFKIFIKDIETNSEDKRITNKNDKSSLGKWWQKFCNELVPTGSEYRYCVKNDRFSTNRQYSFGKKYVDEDWLDEVVKLFCLEDVKINKFFSSFKSKEFKEKLKGIKLNDAEKDNLKKLIGGMICMSYNKAYNKADNEKLEY